MCAATPSSGRCPATPSTFKEHPGFVQPATSRRPNCASPIQGTSDVPDANRPCGNLVICSIPSARSDQAAAIASLGIAARMASQAILAPPMSGVADGLNSQMPPHITPRLMLTLSAATPTPPSRPRRVATKKLRATQVLKPLGYPQGGRDRLCHVHGKMNAWKKSHGNLRE